MSSHPGCLTVERPISEAEAAQQGLPHAAIPGSDAPAQSPLAAPAPAKRLLKRGLMVAVGAAALAVAGHYGYDYWSVGRFQVSTDDAYVQADNTTIAPKVSGYLVDVLVGDNQAVKAGQTLARIDDRDYKVALDQAEADVAAAQAAIASRQAAIDGQQSTIDAADATVQVAQANETFAEQENKRYADLASTGFGSVQNAQQAASRIAASRAAVVRDRAALDAAIKQLALQKAELAQARAMLGHNEAVRNQAEINFGHTAIVSPVDGVVGNRTLRVGQYVQAGTQLMSVVPSAEAYVVANYKETQLTNVRRGQPVDIEVDMFPGRVYHGQVDSLAPASGQTFALLPPDNATGNFTKVVQRIPVKILLDRDSAGSGDLRPGMSVTPSIDTKPKADHLSVAGAAAIPED
jgi:membrane fusion protein (multidrug efflux system)